MSPAIPLSKAAQLIIIWSITAVATCSVLSGIGYGIRRISEVCFCIGLSLMFCVLMLGEILFIFYPDQGEMEGGRDNFWF